MAFMGIIWVLRDSVSLLQTSKKKEVEMTHINFALNQCNVTFPLDIYCQYFLNG